MSNRQLDEIQEEETNKELASDLGISYEDFCELDYVIDTNESSDGLVYSHVITFSDNSPQGILNKIENLDSNNSIRLQLSS